MEATFERRLVRRLVMLRELEKIECRLVLSGCRTGRAGQDVQLGVVRIGIQRTLGRARGVLVGSSREHRADLGFRLCRAFRMRRAVRLVRTSRRRRGEWRVGWPAEATEPAHPWIG